MAKNIVLCCDGTSNEFASANTNVVKLYQTLVHDPARQVLFYHPGLGTMGSPAALTPVARWVTRVLGLAFGYGLSQHLADLYSMVANAFDAGDKLYLFGFSRGAYTARALAAMLHMFGLLRRGNDVMIPYAIRLLKRSDDERFVIAAKFKRTFAAPMKIRFVGVWDTVSSVGTLWDPLHLPFSARNPDIETGRHALALDERRAFYRQNLWMPLAGQDIQQVWFPGVHSDVGGGYAERESGLSKLALKWMADEARTAGLLFDDAKLAQVLGAEPDEYSKPDALAELHDSLRRWWWAEIIPRRYFDPSDPERRKYRWKIPLGRPRFVSDGSSIHRSVVVRRQDASAKYAPRNLPGDSVVVDDPAPIGGVAVRGGDSRPAL
jgi:uncharacterized protein (DUF2235 family)